MSPFVVKSTALPRMKAPELPLLHFTGMGPDDTIDRGQMAALLVRALELPGSSTDHFVDDDTSIFQTEINALAESGITRGCNPPDNDRFCPSLVITRGQMAAFLMRASGFLGD